MSDKHASLGEVADPRRERDHGCTVARRDVPGCETESVRRADRDAAIGRFEIGSRYVRARAVRSDDRHADWQDEPVSADYRCDCECGPTQVATPFRLA
jgi:hypothetical protein